MAGRGKLPPFPHTVTQEPRQSPQTHPLPMVRPRWYRSVTALSQPSSSPTGAGGGAAARPLPRRKEPTAADTEPGDPSAAAAAGVTDVSRRRPAARWRTGTGGVLRPDGAAAGPARAVAKPGPAAAEAGGAANDIASAKGGGVRGRFSQPWPGDARVR